MKRSPKTSTAGRTAERPNLARFALLTLVLLLTLVACSTETLTPPAAADPRPAAPPARQQSQPHEAMLFRGPFYSPPIELGHVPEGEAQPWVRAMAVGDEVEMRALLISATSNVGGIEPSAGAWIAILEQTGTPYDWFVATENTLTMDDLVRPDGVGRYQAILLSTSNLAYDAGGTHPSALDTGEWDTLFEYELAYGVRQVALYAEPYSAPEDYGLESFGDRVELDGVYVTPTPAGLEIFTDLNPTTSIELYGTTGFLGTNPQAGTTPLLMLGSDILAVHVNTGGRERVAMLYNNPAWGASNTPPVYTQQIGPSLLRWALRGVHLGERRASYQADVDDWFNSTGLWNLDLGADDPVEEFEMSAQDMFSLIAQQNALRQVGGGIAPNFTWSMAYNGEPADPASIVDCSLPASQHTLSSMTRCLASNFWWVNHTWSHAYMDWNPPHVGLYTEQIEQEITLGDDISDAFDFGANDSRRSLVTGDISGLGWYAADGPDSGPKIDYGLAASSPYLLEALGITGREYLASNMSTPSHEPDCWGCGIVHPMNDQVFLVPRWPTNLFATVAEPAHVVQAYNQIYGPGGSDPLDGVAHPLTYEEILDIDTDIALVHLLAGSPYPHYFHISNFNEYAPGRSLLYDWTSELFTKYAAAVNEPLLSYKNDDFGDYIRARTEYLASDVTGVWDRVTGQVSITSQSGGPVFFTGASLGAGSTTFDYNGRRISLREFTPGETVIIDLNAEPPVAPVINSFIAAPNSIPAGSDTQLSWTVTGDFDDVTLRTLGGAALATGLSASGTYTVTPAATTTYELVVSRSGMTDITAQAVVTAVAAPTVELTAVPATITIGGEAALEWIVTGATSNIALHQLGDPDTVIGTGLLAMGTQTVAPTATATYQLVATWLGGTVESAPVTVTVTAAPVEPSITLTADPQSITVGQSSQLTWYVSGSVTATLLRVKGGATVTEAFAPNGSQTVSPSETTTYELVATWAGGEVVGEVTVTVTESPDPEPEPETTLHEVTIRLTGEGFGFVVSSPAGLVCLDECTAEFPEGTALTLVPVRLLGSSFGGFSGACEGPACAITIDQPVEIGVRFGFED